MATLPEPVANDNQDDYVSALQDARSALQRAVDARVALGASFADRESAFLQAGNEACRLNLEAELQATADAQGERLLIDGALHRRHEDGSGDYHSLCGTLRVRRPTYRKAGEHNGPTVVPLELAAGLIEGATPAMAYRVALGYAQGPGRRAEEQMHADHRAPPSRSTLERMGKAIGIHARGAAPRIEALVRQEEVLPEGAHAISTGLDRTSVPMEEVRPEGAPPATRRKKRTKPYVRSVPEPIDVNYRMAYVGTVSIVDRDGEALITRRYATSATENPADLVSRMMADIRRAREQSPRIPVGVMQDAAPEMWTIMRGGLKKQAKLRRWHEGVDRYHVNERLGQILRIVEPDEAERPRTLARWNDEFDRDDSTIDRIAMWLADQLPFYQGERLKKLEGHWTFLINNNDRMRYATLRAMGLPCGSGATEGSCKSVVMIRAKGCGQRWHDDGVNAALTLRATYMSDRLPTLWKHITADYTSEVKAAA